MKIVISAESAIDMSKEQLKAYEIYTVPFTVLLGDKSYLDGDVPIDEIFEYVNKNKVLPKTSAVNEYQFKEHFDGLLKDYDAVIHISMSNEMSCAYNNAVTVSKDYDNVYVINSKSLSTGVALLAIYGTKLVKQGLSAKEIVKKIESRVAFIQAGMILTRLDYLYKGGRCNCLQLFGANLLKLRPQIIVRNGKLISGKKYRGNADDAMMKYCIDLLNEFNNPDLSEVFITYTTANVETIEKIKIILKERGFKNIHITRANATVASHCGENCLGVLYINDGLKN